MSKDSENKKSKSIGYFRFKSENGHGDPTRISVFIEDNGVCIIKHLVFTNQEGFNDFKLITERFGKKLYVKYFALKYSTLNTIHNGVTEALFRAKVPHKDIL